MFGKKIIDYTGSSGVKEVTFLTDLTFLSKFKVKNWKHNRPCDLNRVDEIYKTIQINQKVDGIIYIAQQLEENEISYYCYDGNHRVSALKKLPNDLEIPLIINILFNATNNSIIRNFSSLNKSCPVPTIFIKKPNEKRDKFKLTLLEVTKYLIEKYPKNVSTSRNPQKPNFNRDQIMDKLYDHYVLINKFPNKEEIISRLEFINKKYHSYTIIKNPKDKKNITDKQKKKKNDNKISDKILKKCELTGCYLFTKDFTMDL